VTQYTGGVLGLLAGLPAEEVFPGLFLGELGAVYKRTQLKEQKIGSILSAECMPPLWPDVR
jgi:hypothetical protein